MERNESYYNLLKTSLVFSPSKVPNKHGQSPKKQKGLAPTSLKHVFIESANSKDHACTATVTSDNAFINATTAESFTGTSVENIPVRSAISNHQVYTKTGTSDNNDNFVYAESFIIGFLWKIQS